MGNEAEKFKSLVLEKMDKSVLPGIRENVINDFYLTPDYFENDLHFMARVFLFNQNFLNLPILDFIINPKYIKICFLLVLEYPGAGMPGVLSSAKVLKNFF